MNLKLKFTAVALTLSLLAIAGTVEAGFLSSTAFLDQSTLNVQTISGNAQLIFGNDNHSAESIAGDFTGPILSQNENGVTPVSTNLVFNGSGIAFADAFSDTTLVQTSVLDAGNATALAILERSYSISGFGSLLITLDYFLNQEVTGLTDGFSFSNANAQLLDTFSGNQATAFNQILGFDVIGSPFNGNFSFTNAGTLQLQLDNLTDGIQGSLSFLTFGNVETNVSATAVNASVPEPAITWLLGLGLLTLIAKCKLKTDSKPIRLSSSPSPSFQQSSV